MPVVVALSIAIVAQLGEIEFVARAQKLVAHLFDLDLVDKALVSDSSAVAREQIGSAVVDMALRTIVFAHREQFGVHVLDYIVAVGRMILVGNHVNCMMFVASLLNNRGDDVWCVWAVIRLSFRNGDFWIVVRDCIPDCLCFPLRAVNGHGIVRDILLFLFVGV